MEVSRSQPSPIKSEFLTETLRLPCVGDKSLHGFLCESGSENRAPARRDITLSCLMVLDLVQMETYVRTETCTHVGKVWSTPQFQTN